MLPGTERVSYSLSVRLKAGNTVPSTVRENHRLLARVHRPAGRRQPAPRQSSWIDDFIEATASARTNAKHRRLDQLMAVLEPGDRLVVSELSRLGRSLGEVVALLDAIAKARASGKKLGRPKGSLGVSRLDGREDRVRTRFVQKCTVRNGPLTLADRSSCRSSNRSSPHEVLGAVSGLHHPLVAVRGPSRREQPDDVERRQTDSNRPRGTRTRCCNGQTNVFVKHRSDIDHQRQDHRSLQARRLRTSPHTGLTLAPYRAFLHESGSYPKFHEIVQEMNRSPWAMAPVRTGIVSSAGQILCCSTGWGVPNSVGSNGETVLGLKAERAFEVGVWTFNRRCRLL